MENYMEEHGMKEQYETEHLELEQREFAKFSFYTFQSFFEFMTKHFNCFYVEYDIYKSLYSWYKSGFCTPLCFYEEMLRNSGIYRYITSVSNCLLVNDNSHEYQLDEDNFVGIYMNTLHYKIVVWYEVVRDEETEYLDVIIRMPMFCSQCMPDSTTKKHLYHSEMVSKVETKQQEIRMNQCKATYELETYDLCEPKLKQTILQFLE